MQILRHTPPNRLADCYEAIHGYRIENARVLAHASVYEKMFTSALELIDGEESEVKTISRDNAEKNLLAKIRHLAQVLDEKSDDAADYTAQASYYEITAELFRLVLSLLRRLLFIGFGLLALELFVLVLILQHSGSPLV